MSVGIIITRLGGNCPVQAEGSFDGMAFYFRARGCSVTCDVDDWTWDGPEYEWPDAGYISEDTARAFIGEAYAEWKVRTTARARMAARYRAHNGWQSEAMQAMLWAVRIEKAIGDAGKPANDWLMAHSQELMTKASAAMKGEDAP